LPVQEQLERLALQGRGGEPKIIELTLIILVSLFIIADGVKHARNMENGKAVAWRNHDTPEGEAERKFMAKLDGLVGGLK